MIGYHFPLLVSHDQALHGNATSESFKKSPFILDLPVINIVRYLLIHKQQIRFQVIGIVLGQETRCLGESFAFLK